MRGKNYKAAAEKVDRDQSYSIEEGLRLTTETKVAKFDETVDVAINLGVDAKKSDQMVRGAVNLPQGLGKNVRVLVFAKGESAQEASEAGADYVGAEDLIEKISKDGWLDFDTVVATPDLMAQVSQIGRILGPRGMMPNPKTGTVTKDVGKAVTDAKKGKVDYKMDKGGVIHASIGRVSFGPDRLNENLGALMDSVRRAKPSSAKGVYIKAVTVSTTMGPGIRLDRSAF
jgi:large subunit ribosomal protein L1